jgi:hypothetical protein
MTSTARGLLFWTPRILCIAFALFISLFALDVFGEQRSLGETLIALVMHLIPTAIVLIVLAVSWRWEWVGGIACIALGILYVVMAWRRFPLGVYFLIAGPLVLTGILFLLNWYYRKELRPAS